MIVVVGGQSRKVGKTTVICQLIAATAELRWTAWKVTPHTHEPGSSADPDTERFLRAGATASKLISGKVPAVLPQGNLVVESNSAVDIVRPDLVLYVFDPANPDVKPSAAAVRSRADFELLVTDKLPPEVIAAVRQKHLDERRS